MNNYIVYISRKLTMRVGYSQSVCTGLLIALNLLASAASADPVASTTPAAPAASVAPLVSATYSDLPKPTDPKKLMEQAEAALNDEDLVAALKFAYQAAIQNYIPAQVRLGEFAESSQFYEEAVGWYLTAAMQGDAAGQIGLSRMYGTGNGIEKDPAKALYWMKRAAAQNNLSAVKAIADAYRVGGYDGLIKIDLDQSKLWYAKLARLQEIARKEADKKMAELLASRKKLFEEAAKKRQEEDAKSQ